MGRPSSFTQEVADAICARLEAGESLRAICRTDESMPPAATIFRWLEANEAFREQYTRARTTGYQLLADEIIDIADDSSNDWVERENVKTGRVETVLDSDHVQRSKLRIDTRKWMLSKMLPKVYGDKLDIHAKVETDAASAILAARGRAGESGA